MASASSATRTVLRLEHEDVHLSFSLCSEAAGYTDDELVLVVHGYNGLNIEAKNGLPLPNNRWLSNDILLIFQRLHFLLVVQERLEVMYQNCTKAAGTYTNTGGDGCPPLGERCRPRVGWLLLWA